MATLTKSKNVTAFRLDSELEEKMQVVADREYLTRSDILRRALRQFLAQYDQKLPKAKTPSKVNLLRAC